MCVSITGAETCNNYKSGGLAGVSSGLRFSRPRRGNKGYVSAGEENSYLAKMQAAPTAALLDPSGKIGHLYDAKTSPQMVVINPQGVVIYDGAIDDKPTTDLEDVPGATNYVNLALEQAMSGKQVATPATRPYGCSVKYADATH